MQQARQEFVDNLIRKFEVDPESVNGVEKPLLKKFLESQNRAKLVASRIDQLKKQVELLTNQIRISETDLQQEVGKGAGVIEAILALADGSPDKAPEPPSPNRKERRAAAAKGRKGNGKASAKKAAVSKLPTIPAAGAEV
jgi:hypothetical protein